MPQCCSVPLCSSRTSGHRFPKDKQMRKTWIVAIKRDKFKVTNNSRVCNKHFIPSDYVLPRDSVLQNPKPRLKRDAVPSQFHWTEKPTASVEQRRERSKNRSLIKQTLHLASVSSDCISMQETIPEICNEVELLMDTITPTDKKDEIVEKCNASTMTSMSISSFCIEKLQGELKKDELHFYTGFNSYDHFMLVFNILGPAVNYLLYYPSGCAMKVHMLTPVNEFLLTIVKLRCNMSNKELSFKFDISEALVSRIFITWINFLYCQLKEINIWTPFEVAKNNLKYKGQKCNSTVIIDCTEIKIDKPKNPISQQATFSTYKSSNTLKVLVGISCSGNVTFISEAYGGSISDRCLFEKCGLSDLLEKNDIVLADRGFQIQDILASKDVTLNMPEFLKKKAGQLEPVQLYRSKKTSSNRIHIERVIGLAKTYKILQFLSSNLVNLGSRIIFVCFILSNFRYNIMDSRD